jgi:hypothetical protein
MGRRALWVGCAAAAAAVALAGCGGGGKSSSGSAASHTATAASGAQTASPAPLPAGTPAALRRIHGPLLVANELDGLVPRGSPTPATSVQSFTAEDPPSLRSAEAARLKALGFVAAVTQPLAASAGATGEGVSLVEEYRSSGGASGEVASQQQQAIGRGESAFAVAGIPGARGFGFNGSQGPNANVAFAVGPDYYLVGFQAHANGGPTRAQLIAAAQSLYRRVRS